MVVGLRDRDTGESEIEKEKSGRKGYKSLDSEGWRRTGSQGKGGSGKVGTELQHGPFISVLFWGVGGGEETGSAEDG